MTTDKSKTDITQYSDEELSLLFLNDEGLYNEMQRAVRRDNFSMIKELAEELYHFTPAQMEDLEETFTNEMEEHNNE